MKRRDFLVLVGGAAAWPLEARAQQPEQMRRLGVLMGDANNTHGQALVTAFLQELRNLGWTEGRNLRVDLRWSGGDSDRMQEFAKELVQLHSDVILTRSTPTTAALQRETQAIPIVFLIVSDPVGDGLVASLSRPVGNSTGFVNVEASMGGKWLQLLNEIAPRTKKVALLFNPKTAPGGGSFFSGPFEAATRTVAVEPILAPVHDKAEIERAINSLGRGGDGGLLAVPQSLLMQANEVIE